MASMLKQSKQSEHMPVITVDGPGGAGKGTVSAMVAQRLGWHFLDSGAIYRCLAYQVLTKSIDITDHKRITAEALALAPHFAADTNTITLNDEDVTSAIRSVEVGQTASQISAYLEVREALLDCQRQFAKTPGLVADGRDMGTIVFPNAALKIFLDAAVAERAKRRYAQLQAQGTSSNLESIIEDLENRDARDKNRHIAPLQAAAEAVVIDTTMLSIAEVVEKVLALAQKHHLLASEQV